MTPVPHSAAVIGLGEVGAVFARALMDHGVAVKVASRPSANSRDRAAALGLPLESAAAAAAGSDLVLLTMTGESLEAVAAEVAPALAEGAMVANLTAAAPRQVKAAGSVIEKGGAEYVDVAIMGAVSLHGARTPLMASGPAAPRLASAMNGLGFNVQARPGSAVGDASALKLLRSVFAKALDAVVVEAMMAAEALGLRAELVEQLGDFDRSPLRDHIDMYLRTHQPHAARRLVEMEEAEAQLIELGVASLTTHAAVERYRRTLALSRELAPPRGSVDADAAVAWMLSAERAHAAGHEAQNAGEGADVAAL